MQHVEDVEDVDDDILGIGGDYVVPACDAIDVGLLLGGGRGLARLEHGYVLVVLFGHDTAEQYQKKVKVDSVVGVQEFLCFL